MQRSNRDLLSGPRRWALDGAHYAGTSSLRGRLVGGQLHWVHRAEPSARRTCARVRSCCL